MSKIEFIVLNMFDKGIFACCKHAHIFLCV